MVVIHLARAGRRNRPFWHIVVQNNTSPRDGGYIEKLGHYDPLDPKNESCKMDLDRYTYWVGVGAQASNRVKSLAKNASKVVVADQVSAKASK